MDKNEYFKIKDSGVDVVIEVRLPDGSMGTINTNTMLVDNDLVEVTRDDGKIVKVALKELTYIAPESECITLKSVDEAIKGQERENLENRRNLT